MIEAMKQALEALELEDMAWRYEKEPTPEHIAKAITSLRQAIEQAEKKEPLKLWLWKNFVGGKPEYWAFDNPFPCMSVEGDPITLGEPCGWAFLKPSVNGRPHRSEQEVINTVTRLATTTQPQQAEKQEPQASLLGAIARAWCYEENANKEMDTQLAHAIAKEVSALYTTPQPQREWVGLTDEEVIKCTPTWGGTVEDVARAIEAKLKERNHDA